MATQMGTVSGVGLGLQVLCLQLPVQLTTEAQACFAF